LETSGQQPNQLVDRKPRSESRSVIMIRRGSSIRCDGYLVFMRIRHSVPVGLFGSAKKTTLGRCSTIALEIAASSSSNRGPSGTSTTGTPRATALRL
jgi:hypothetical protein